MMSAKQILKEHWGYDNFRPLQEEIIQSVLQKKDVLAILPTGGGKSICFQVPALATEGICLVISPLIALIKDQVESLKSKGILALSIYSGMRFIEVKKTLENAVHGNYKFLYVSPERLETKLFLEYLPALPINLIAVDEAHCISQWGYDFRPSYLNIASIRERVSEVGIIALTASATPHVQNDICEKLLFNATSERFQQSFERPNLSYSVFNVSDKFNKLVTILTNVKGTAIVYCKNRKRTQDIADLLRMQNISSDYYHAGLSNDQRNAKQESWIKNKTRVMVCTNAFGMGIDKPDVRLVIHYDVPDCMENYYQEAGRAGRDGKKAYAVLLYSNKEINDLNKQSDIHFPAPENIKKMYVDLMNFLQVAAGSGEGTNVDFDMAQFAHAFKHDILTVTYAIKALQQEGLLTFNEVFFKPSSVVFTASKEDLFDLEQKPELDALVKGLLRCYAGIFDFPCTIYESQLAKFLKQPIDSIKQRLMRLSQLGIIVYNAQVEGAQLTLLKNRMYADAYKINVDTYLQRKNAYVKRIASIVQYVGLTAMCRSRYIATYFGANELKNCLICDNCLDIKNAPISTDEFAGLTGELMAALGIEGVVYKDLTGSYGKTKREKVIQVLDYLLSENKIKLSKDGRLFKKSGE